MLDVSFNFGKQEVCPICKTDENNQIHLLECEGLDLDCQTTDKTTLRCLIDKDSVLINLSQKIQPPLPYSTLHAKKIGDQILVKMDYLFIKLDHPYSLSTS